MRNLKINFSDLTKRLNLTIGQPLWSLEVKNYLMIFWMQKLGRNGSSLIIEGLRQN